MESRIVKLNVGGKMFVTSSTTLLSGGETFFSSLLSGRHQSQQDENGAYFIDRSPKYFGPILHYLRTNVIDIPPNYTLSSIQMEAEFYGIQKIVDHIDYLTAEKQEQREMPFFVDKGCYVDDSGKNAYMFGESNNVILVTNKDGKAYEQAIVVGTYPKLPTEWSSHEKVAENFASFYQNHVNKGKYTMNADRKGMLMEMPLMDQYGNRESDVVSVMGSFSSNFNVLSICNKPHSFLPAGRHYEGYITFNMFKFRPF